MRRRSLIVQLALVGVLALLAFPGSSSALRPTFVITLTPSGPSPAVLKIPADLGSLWFRNTDTATHAVVFENGSCSIQVAPGAGAQCPGELSFPGYVGDYEYTVDGTSHAHLVVDAIGRSVSLVARSHSIGHGSRLTLHGRLQEANSNWSPPSAGSPQPIIVLARPDRHHAFHRIAVVTARWDRAATKRAPFGELRWQFGVRPRAKTIYIAEANFQPKGGQVWQRAWSKPFRVHF